MICVTLCTDIYHELLKKTKQMTKIWIIYQNALSQKFKKCQFDFKYDAMIFAAYVIFLKGIQAVHVRLVVTLKDVPYIIHLYID